MSATTSTLKFEQRLCIGNDYADFVVPVMWAHGWPTYVYQSKEAQWACGESVNRIEVKLDRRFRDTGRLFIETRERRADDGTSPWRRSGIYDKHDPRLYAIGDYQTIYLLGVRWLRHLAPGLKSWKGETSEGLFLPVATAEECAVDVIEVRT